VAALRLGGGAGARCAVKYQPAPAAMTIAAAAASQAGSVHDCRRAWGTPPIPPRIRSQASGGAAIGGSARAASVSRRSSSTARRHAAHDRRCSATAARSFSGSVVSTYSFSANSLGCIVMPAARGASRAP
jgi:hypothetical protein